MLTRIDLRGSDADPRELLPRAKLDVEATLDAVRPICEAVREHGDAGVREMTQRFDGADVPVARVPATAIDAAVAGVDAALRAALEELISRTRLVHAAQLPADRTVQVVPGGTVAERYVPVRRVGLYVPGGLLAYPSSVVMNVVPAQTAGVDSLAVTSPPQADGLPDAAVLAACGLLGIDEVYAVGGAQAVAMFAYGTGSCPWVDVVTGPGNIFVTAAKRLLKGLVGVDAEAGPSEVAILADHSADPDWVAADLIAQAEHDPNAACLLVTDSVDLADEVDRRVAVRVPAALHSERIETALSNQSGTVVVSDLEQGLRVIDEWAAEHLQVMTVDAEGWAARVRNAGAIFIGPYSPVPLGDYLAGSNHILPTGGTARHTSGLNVGSFLRTQHVVTYDRDALAGTVEHITALAGAEQLLAHAESVQTRFRT